MPRFKVNYTASGDVIVKVPNKNLVEEHFYNSDYTSTEDLIKGILMNIGESGNDCIHITDVEEVAAETIEEHVEDWVETYCDANNKDLDEEQFDLVVRNISEYFTQKGCKTPGDISDDELSERVNAEVENM